MEELMQWEYRFETLGSGLRGPREEEVEVLLDEWGEEGWEVVTAFATYGTRQIKILAKRPLTKIRRRQRGWPGT